MSQIQSEPPPDEEEEEEEAAQNKKEKEVEVDEEGLSSRQTPLVPAIGGLGEVSPL